MVEMMGWAERPVLQRACLEEQRANFAMAMSSPKIELQFVANPHIPGDIEQ
jgi:hypothetical protein